MSKVVTTLKVLTKMQDTGLNGTCYCHGDSGNNLCGCKISSAKKSEELNNSPNAKCSNCGHYISRHFD